MAYLQARAGIARSGVTYAGWVTANLRFQVNNITRQPRFADFSIEESLDSTPSRLTFSVEAATFEPQVYQPVSFAWSTPDYYWFTGTILRRRLMLDKSGGRLWRCEAIDNTWLMDRWTPVTVSYRDLGVNSIVARLIANFTNGGFTVGHCPSSFGNIDAVDFDNLPVSACLDQLAAACGAFWYVNALRQVFFFDTLPDSNDLTITNTSSIRIADYDEDGTQIRNQTTVIGKGSQTTAVVAPAATTIPVDDTSIFASGGQVSVGGNVVTYTGRTPTSGPGSLTGCTGITQQIPQGQLVEVSATFADTAAQTALAALLGGGLSGVAAFTTRNPVVTDPEARLLADEDVTSFKDVLKGFTFETGRAYTQERHVTIGKTIAVSLTTPITASGTMRVQTVSIVPRGTLLSATPEFTRRVNARTLFRNVSALLARTL